MPRPRQYETTADRVAAFRARKKAQEQQIEEAALPRPSGVPNIASGRRWKALLTKAQENLQAAVEDMQSYYDDRTEEWQESDRGQELADKIAELETLASNLDDLLIP